MSQRARHWALLVKRDMHAIYCAARDPRVPWYAKALAFCLDRKVKFAVEAMRPDDVELPS